MKIYNFLGYLVIFSYALACAGFAPAHLGPWRGLWIGETYFIGCWFLVGVYLADVLHLGIAHRSLNYRPWFIQAITLMNNTFGLYVDPISWVNRHRLHHKFSDHAGDPNKLAADGFWRTLYLCIFPYHCDENLATDTLLKTWPFRLTANLGYAVLAQAFSFWLLWRFAQDFRFAAIMWIGMRVFAVWVNMVQNYWTHTRTFGSRRYDDDHDNAMNISEWLPVTASFSACLQNNHHHYPNLLRLSHHPQEYDFGFLTVKGMKRLGLVEATHKGRVMPAGLPLAELGI